MGIQDLLVGKFPPVTSRIEILNGNSAGRFPEGIKHKRQHVLFKLAFSLLFPQQSDIKFAQLK